MMMVFSEFGVSSRLEDFDCIILQSTRQVQMHSFESPLLNDLQKCSIVTCFTPKEKYFLNYQYTCIVWWALEPWYDCWWWRFQCTWYEQIGLITNVASDSSAVKPHTHEIYNGSGEVSCTSFLSHINGLDGTWLWVRLSHSSLGWT